MKSPWYKINAAAGADHAEILLYDVIGGYDYDTGKSLDGKTFIADLQALGDVTTIDLRIHSPGGSVWEGNAIYNALARHPAKITTYIDGLAASMASIIAMVGSRIIMADNAMLMIHNPWTLADGDAARLRRTADMLDKVKQTAVRAYRAHSHLTENELAAAMDAETWYDANEALAAGLATAIGPSAPALAACLLPPAFNLSRGVPARAAHLVDLTHVHPTAQPPIQEPAAPHRTFPPDTAGNHPNSKTRGPSMFDKIKQLLGLKAADGETEEQSNARLDALVDAYGEDKAAITAHFNEGRDAVAALRHDLTAAREQIAELTAANDAADQRLAETKANLEAANQTTAELQQQFDALKADIDERPPVVIDGAENQGDYREAWEADADLQRRYKTADAYADYKQAEAAWKASDKLRADFPSAAAYAAYRRHYGNQE